MKTYRVYVRDVFVGEAKGRDEKRALDSFVSECGFDCVEEYAREAFAKPDQIDLRLKGAVLW
jgi:hypothetical protein